MTTKVTVEELSFHGFLREASRQKFSQVCRSNEFVSCDFSSDLASGSVDHVSAMYLTGPKGAVALKMYYNIQTARTLVAKTLRCPLDEVTEQLASDFLKEYLNLITGNLRGICERIGLVFDMSLPSADLVAKEAVDKEFGKNGGLANGWILTNGEQSFLFSARLQLVTSSVLLSKIPLLAAEIGFVDGVSRDGKAQGEVEFF